MMYDHLRKYTDISIWDNQLIHWENFPEMFPKVSGRKDNLNFIDASGILKKYCILTFLKIKDAFWNHEYRRRGYRIF